MPDEIIHAGHNQATAIHICADFQGGFCKLIVVGERINTSRKIKGEQVIEKAVVERDKDYITKLAQEQEAAGATFIDVNCGTLTSGEPEALEWLTQVVMEACPHTPVSFDSPNPAALRKGLECYEMSHGQPLVNSITAESERYENVLPLVKEFKTKVIALAMDDTGIQQDAGKRLDVARKLVSDLAEADIPLDDIYVDPLTFPIGTGNDVAIALLDIIEKIMAEFPGVHTIAGISNISHGMPARKILNQAMTVLAIGKGLDGGIIDPNDRYLMALIYSAEALMGKDDFCMNYITKAREGVFEGL